jgi:hypothetical protein
MASHTGGGPMPVSEIVGLSNPGPVHPEGVTVNQNFER